MSKVIVSNLAEVVTEDDLEKFFSDYDVVKIDFRAGKYAAVTFESDWGASEALIHMDGVFWHGRRLRIKLANWS